MVQNCKSSNKLKFWWFYIYLFNVITWILYFFLVLNLKNCKHSTILLENEFLYWFLINGYFNFAQYYGFKIINPKKYLYFTSFPIGLVPIFWLLLNYRVRSCLVRTVVFSWANFRTNYPNQYSEHYRTFVPFNKLHHRLVSIRFVTLYLIED